MSRASRYAFGASDRLVFRLVCEHRPFAHIADGPDARYIGAEMVVGYDAPARITLNAGLVQSQPIRIRTPSNGDQHHIGIEIFSRPTLGGLDGNAERFARV